MLTPTRILRGIWRRYRIFAEKSCIYGWRRTIHVIYRAQFKRYCRDLGIKDKRTPGERAYVDKWKVFGWPVEPYSYRLYRGYRGDDPAIVPEDIARTFIEPVLCPHRYRGYYMDKNIFDELFVEGTLPVTVLRRMDGGVLLNADYTPCDLAAGLAHLIPQSYDKLILKPTKDTSSGLGVMLFERKGEKFISAKENQELTLDFLDKYGENFILQEAIRQHPVLMGFNPTSVNTLRLAVYRSTKDEAIAVTGALIRVGRSGEICDNGHAGEKFVGIDLETGRLNHYACDQYGNVCDSWNGVDYKNNDFVIPCWDDVKRFSQYVCSKLHHCRLVQLDITVNAKGKPQLIEFNIEGFSYWLFLFSGQNPWGCYTDEIISYCKGKDVDLQKL